MKNTPSGVCLSFPVAGTASIIKVVKTVQSLMIATEWTVTSMRLINADEALRSLPDDLPYKDSVRRVLVQAPTVDAVRVIRCMDCESARELTQHESLYLADGVLICTNCEVSGSCRLPVWPQHFCGYGRQKGGSEDDHTEVVTIVRCEYCLFWESGENECESWEWCKMLNTDMPADGFCKYGARKEESNAK